MHLSVSSLHLTINLQLTEVYAVLTSLSQSHGIGKKTFLLMDFNIAISVNSCSDSVLYINYLFTKRHQESWKKDGLFHHVIWKSQSIEISYQFVSKNPVWQEIRHLYCYTITWNDDMKCTTKQVDKNFYLAIHQVSLTGNLNVLWTCSVYKLDSVVFLCNMCQWTNVSEALSSVH